jgi:DNA-binding SARP family transcriptional activator
MRLDHFTEMRFMLDNTKGGHRAPDGEGRSYMTAWFASVKPRLPRLLQRVWPSDFVGALLMIAFAWSASTAVVATYLAMVASDPLHRVLVGFTGPIIVIALAGILYPTRLWTLIPNGALWLLLLVTDPTGPNHARWIDATALAEVAIASFAVLLNVARKRQSTHVLATHYKASVNQLGWDLYSLSTTPPVTDESVDGVVVYEALKVGEVERHFDQVTSASIQGQMQHAFRISGSGSSINDLPFRALLGDTQSFYSLNGSGTSDVQLGLSGSSRDDLTSDAFVAVFEQQLPDGTIDTIRAIVPSAGQARFYVGQLLSAWRTQLGANTESEQMLRKYSGTIYEGIASDSSYAGDRLTAILRLPHKEQPTVMVIGEAIGPHAVLAGAIRFGPSGPLYQLFPVALIHALSALIAGRPIPKPPSGSPPTSPAPAETSEDVGIASASSESASQNGHQGRLSISTLGALRLVDGSGDLTSALLDRKVLAFLWLYLFARALRSGQDSVTRASLADELSPGLDASTQRSRLRGRLSELRNQLPLGLGRRVIVSGDRIRLDLSDCDVDVQQFVESARSYSNSNGIVTTEQLTRLESLVAQSPAAFLPEWDEIEQHVNSGRGGAGEVVADLRHRVEVARSNLLRSLGEGYLAHANAERAVNALEQALELSPDDEAAARSLVAACLQSGRLARADQLRKEFSLV